MRTLSRRHLWGVAGVSVFGGLAVSVFGQGRFDGALDFHITSDPVVAQVALIDMMVAIGSPSVLFWLASQLIHRSGRFMDFVLAVCVARAVYVPVGVALCLTFPDPQVFAQILLSPNPMAMTGLAVASGFSLLGLGWLVVLLFTGYRCVSGLSGRRLGLSFALTLVTAEVLSSVFLWALA